MRTPQETQDEDHAIALLVDEHWETNKIIKVMVQNQNATPINLMGDIANQR